MKKLIIYSIAFLLFFVSCKKEMRWDNKKWNEQTELDFSPKYRNLMIDDLIKNHKLVGLKYSEVINLLGEPNLKEKSKISYSLVINLGSDIDPVYTKYLSFYLSKDSIVKSFKIEEWRK